MLTSLWDETHYSKSFQYQVNSPLNLFELLYSQISPTTIIWTFSDGPAFELVPKEKKQYFPFLVSILLGSNNGTSSTDSLETCWEIKTESTRKLSTFNSQWTKTLYQNNLKNIATFFYIFQGTSSSVITPKTISHGSPRKWMSNFTRIVKTQVKFWKFHV